MQAALFSDLGGAVLVAGLFTDMAPRRRGVEELVEKLKHGGIRPRLFDIGAALGWPSEILVPNACLPQELGQLAVTDVIIVVPPQFMNRAMAELRGHISTRPRLIAFWDGSLQEPLATIQNAASELNAIWTPTACLAEILVAALPNFSGQIDVVCIGSGGRIPRGEFRAAARKRLKLPNDAFVVGAELDIGDTLTGQNPSGILTAFKTAFGDDDDVFLLLRCDCPDSGEEKLAQLTQMAAHPRILLIDTLRHYLPRTSFLQAVDVWLSLQRDAADRAGINDALVAGLQVVTSARGLPARLWRHPAVHPVRFQLSELSEGQSEWIAPEIIHAAGVLSDLRHFRRAPC